MAVTEILEAEHRTVLAKLEAFAAAAERKDLASLRDFLPFFLNDIQSHRRKEEEVLFPALGKYIGVGQGPIHCMLEEHREEKRMLAEIASALAPDSGVPVDRVCSLVDRFVDFLRTHIRKENEVLFPLAESVLSLAEKERIFAGMNKIGACCDVCAHTKSPRVERVL